MKPCHVTLRATLLALAAMSFPAIAGVTQSCGYSWPSIPGSGPEPRIYSVWSEADERIEFLGVPLPAATTIDHRGEMSIFVDVLDTITTIPVKAMLDGREIDVPMAAEGRCSPDGIAVLECPSGARPNLRLRHFVLPTQNGGQFTYVVRERDDPSKTHTATLRIR